MSGAELVEKATVAQRAGATCELVGNWVWAEFPSKPSPEVRETLKREGYHWNHKRGLWQFAGVPCRHSPASTVEIKTKYGAITMDEAAHA